MTSLRLLLTATILLGSACFYRLDSAFVGLNAGDVRARTRLILGAAVLGILELPGLWIGPQGARHTREAGRP